MVSYAQVGGASRGRTWNKVGTHNAYVSQLTAERVLTLSGLRKPMACSLSSVGREFHEQVAISKCMKKGGEFGEENTGQSDMRKEDVRVECR